MSFDKEKEQAIIDANAGRFVCCRRLLAGPDKLLVVFGIVGPYPQPHSELLYFSYINSRTRCAALPAMGDGFSALMMAIELCKVNIFDTIREYEGELFYETGERYFGVDFSSKSHYWDLFGIDQELLRAGKWRKQ